MIEGLQAPRSHCQEVVAGPPQPAAQPHSSILGAVCEVTPERLWLPRDGRGSAHAQKLRWIKEVKVLHGRSKGTELEPENPLGPCWLRLPEMGARLQASQSSTPAEGSRGQLMAPVELAKGWQLRAAFCPPRLVSAVTAGSPDIWGWHRHE